MIIKNGIVFKHISFFLHFDKLDKICCFVKRMQTIVQKTVMQFDRNGLNRLFFKWTIMNYFLEGEYNYGTEQKYCKDLRGMSDRLGSGIGLCVRNGKIRCRLCSQTGTCSSNSKS